MPPLFQPNEIHATHLFIKDLSLRVLTLLKSMAEIGKPLSGVVFVDQKTIPSHDLGQIIRALLKLWTKAKEWDWNNRIYDLRCE